MAVCEGSQPGVINIAHDTSPVDNPDKIILLFFNPPLTGHILTLLTCHVTAYPPQAPTAPLLLNNFYTSY